MYINGLLAKLNSVVIFKKVAEGPVLSALSRFFTSEESAPARVKAYTDFISELYKVNYSFSDYLLDALSADENDYVILRSRGADIPPLMQECVSAELEIFNKLAELTSEELTVRINYDGFLPRFYTTERNLPECFEERMQNIGKYGYGIYARSNMFTVEGTEVRPVMNPDPVTVDQLIGYELQRQQLIDNTKALLEGRPAANALLYGAAGTGKSSSVKAITNLLSEEGLRLIQIRKDQMTFIPYLLEKLKSNPLKFILFIDDLSFNKDDDNFSALKGILEGSATAKSSNVVIYVTSNRRHLVRENFSDREGDEIHRNDTIQQMFSLANRFGLLINFSKPDQKLFLEIVHGLAEQKGLQYDPADLDVKAAAFAIRHGGQSPRVAEQFVDSLL